MGTQKPEVVTRSRYTAGGTPVDVLDVRVRVPGTADSNGYEKKWTAVLVTGESPLPDFRLTPSAVWALKVAGWLTGIRPLEFGEHPATEEFGRTYSLWPADEAGQVRVRDLFTREVLDFFASRPGWSVTSEGGEVMVWREERVLAPGERAALAEEAVEVYRVLFRSHRDGGEVLEALAARGPQFSIALSRVVVPFGCGVSGMALGGAAAALLFLAFPADRGWVAGVTFLLTTVAGFLGGAVAGWRWTARRSERSRERLPAPGSAEPE